MPDPTNSPAPPGATGPTALTYISDEIGSSIDTVGIILGQDKILYAQSWTLESSVLSQPSKWSVRIGFGNKLAMGWYYRYPPRTPFQLTINGAVQATGFTDRRRLEDTAGGTTLIISGRDALAPLHDGMVEAQTSFQNATYSSMVQRVLTEVGIDPDLLVTSNTNNRRIATGVPVQETAPAETVDQLAQSVPGTVGATNQKLQAKVGQKWLEFLRKQLDRAGLMIWAGVDGKIILSTPNAAQQPAYTLFRNLTQTAGQTNILEGSVEDNATNRHSEATVYGRGGGRKAGRQKAKGLYADLEMQGWGYQQALVLRDAYTQTGANAAYFCRRKLAEERREGFVLTYTFAGHTLPFGSGLTTPDPSKRAVVVPDTTVWVNDAILGIQGVFYVESVRRERRPETVTTIRLMRPEDLVFGDILSTAAQAPPTKKPQTGAPGAFRAFEDGGVSPDGTASVTKNSSPWTGGSSSGGSTPATGG